jgi:hypothetical protein
MAIEYKTHPNFDPEEVEYFFGKRGWPVSRLRPTDVELMEATKGAALECADGRSDNFPGEEMYGPRVFGGINAVAAMLYGGDFDALHEAARKVRSMGFAPGTHSAEHGGCGCVDLWMQNNLDSAVFRYALRTEEITKNGIKLGDWLRVQMKLMGGKHIRLRGEHIEEAVRLNPFIGLTEKADDARRFRSDDWVLNELGVPNRQRYLKVAECVEKLKPDATKIEILIP